MIPRRLLKRLSSLFPSTIMGDGRGDIFFTRYDLIRCRWFQLYLHEFKRSDNSRCLHDHPWWFVTWILADGYYEECPTRDKVTGKNGLFTTTKEWKRPGSILYRRAEFTHRIALRPDTAPWSLVLVGKHSRPWGFWTPLGWLAWKKGDPNPICETNG